MRKVSRYASAILFGLLPITEHEAVASNITTPLRPSISTCPFRTINYITHTLPQQCLRTSWARQETTRISLDHPSDTTSGDDVIRSYSEPLEHVAQPRTVSITQEAVSEVPSATKVVASPKVSANAASSGSTLIDQDSVQAVYTQVLEPMSAESAASTASSIDAVSTDPDAEAESPLDNANFLSFEDWKKQNLERSGQSAEYVGNDRPPAGSGEARRRPGSINNALDSLGEDTEIELEFGGFADPKTSEGSTTFHRNVRSDEKGKIEEKEVSEPTPTGVPLSAKYRSKDAGKTYKERFNYASFDCAATVLKANSQCKGVSSVLVENKDSYMLNECAAPNKFLIIELCNDILIDTVVLANFEFFSSMFRTFRVSVSDRYPVKLDKWRNLGSFEARNTREVQAFLVENPLIWARYLRIEFLSHFGNEYYCPVSLLRVHGTTMMEEFRHQEEVARGEEDVGMEEDEPEGTVDGTRTNKVVAEDLRNEIGVIKAVESIITQQVDQSKEAIQKASEPDSTIAHSAETQSMMELTSRLTSSSSIYPIDHMSALQVEVLSTGLSTTDPICLPTTEPITVEMTVQSSAPFESSSTLPQSSTSNNQIDPNSQHQTVSSVSSYATSDSQKSITSSRNVSDSVSSLSSATAIPTTKIMHQIIQNASKPHSSATSPPPANPTTQEGFFKTLHKRLQLLETNSTLSLKYIEEQSRNLRDAFMKVERRQLAKTTTFLENLNTTVLTELKEFRQQYEQIWQSTVIELESQREQSQREIVAVSARLSVLADELVFQKRMSIVQSLLILLCLGLAMFSRSAANGYLELPLVHNIYARSQSTIRSFESPPGSPSSTRPTSPKQRKSRFGLFRNHSRGPSEGSTSGARSPALEFSPPTPTTDEGSTEHCSGSVSSSGSPEPTRRNNGRDEVRSGPATPSGRYARRRHSLGWRENELQRSGLLRPHVVHKNSALTTNADDEIMPLNGVDERNGTSKGTIDDGLVTPLSDDHITLDGHENNVNAFPVLQQMPSPPPEMTPETPDSLS